MALPISASIRPQDYSNLESHLAAIVEKYTGMVCLEWMDFETDFCIDDLVKNEIAMECFEAFCPGFSPGEGDIRLAMECDTVEEFIRYFESVADEAPSSGKKLDFRFNFSS